MVLCSLDTSSGCHRVIQRSLNIRCKCRNATLCLLGIHIEYHWNLVPRVLSIRNCRSEHGTTFLIGFHDDCCWNIVLRLLYSSLRRTSQTRSLKFSRYSDEYNRCYRSVSETISLRQYHEYPSARLDNVWNTKFCQLQFSFKDSTAPRSTGKHPEAIKQTVRVPVRFERRGVVWKTYFRY